jgi:hypothetical protein
MSRRFQGSHVAASDWGYYDSWTKKDVLHLAKSVVIPFSLEGDWHQGHNNR